MNKVLINIYILIFHIILIKMNGVFILMKKYEYKLVRIDDRCFESEINKLGNEGWNIIDYTFMSFNNTHKVLLKRTHYDFMQRSISSDVTPQYILDEFREENGL